MRIPEESAVRFDPLATALGVGVVGAFALHVYWLNGVAEDAFISFRFAQNWVSGAGLVWNPGEAPVEGYTNFLWVVVSSAILALGLDLPLASQWIGFAASLVTIGVCHRCGVEILGWSRRYAWLACAALAASGPFATWSGAGMETSLFAMFVILALYGLSRRPERTHERDLHLGLGSLLLACLTRPEGILIAALLAAVAIATRWPRIASAMRGDASLIAIYAGAFALYFAWRWSYFGDPLPNTFYAKTGGGSAQLVRGLRYCGLFALHFLLPWVGLLGLAAWARFASPARKADASHADPSLWTRLSSPPLLLSCTVITLTYTAYVATVGGDYMAMYRFFAPLSPLLYLLIAAAVRPAWASATSHLERTFAFLLLLLALAGTVFHSTPWESAWVEEPRLMHGNYRGVETERWYVARHHVIGDFFARYGRPGESLATAAIGAVAFDSGLLVHDVHGIVDRHIAHAGTTRRAAGTGLPGHEKTDFPYLFDKQPTFYMFGRRLYERPLPGIPLIDESVDERVRREYRVRSVWLEDEANGESGYFAFLERRDRASAALFRADEPLPKLERESEGPRAR